MEFARGGFRCPSNLGQRTRDFARPGVACRSPKTDYRPIASWIMWIKSLEAGERRLWAHIRSMDAIQIVAAKGNGITELWAVAGTPERALTDLLRRLPSGWIVTLTGESLTPDEAAVFDISFSEPQKLVETG